MKGLVEFLYLMLLYFSNYLFDKFIECHHLNTHIIVCINLQIFVCITHVIISINTHMSVCNYVFSSDTSGLHLVVNNKSSKTLSAF